MLRIDVPAADRHDKPVYIGTDPMKGTYKSDYGGMGRTKVWKSCFPFQSKVTELCILLFAL